MSPLQSKVIQEKIKQLNLEKYGTEYFLQSKEAQHFRKPKYTFEEQNFDSKPELAFYIYCKDQGFNIQKYSGEGFEYFLNDQKHLYFPDFEVKKDEELILFEIKGDQFLKEDGSWQNPYDNSSNNLYEAKHQCALKNNVVILYSRDYQKYIEYVTVTYGKHFFEKFKNLQKENL